MDSKQLSDVMSELGKRSHRKSPRPKAYYRAMQAKSVAKRKANKKLSPDNLHTARD